MTIPLGHGHSFSESFLRDAAVGFGSVFDDVSCEMSMELAYALVALGLMGMAMATTDRPRSHVSIAMAALAWPLTLAAIAVHVGWCKYAQKKSTARPPHVNGAIVLN